MESDRGLSEKIVEATSKGYEVIFRPAPENSYMFVSLTKDDQYLTKIVSYTVIAEAVIDVLGETLHYMIADYERNDT